MNRSVQNEDYEVQFNFLISKNNAKFESKNEIFKYLLIFLESNSNESTGNHN